MTVAFKEPFGAITFCVVKQTPERCGDVKIYCYDTVYLLRILIIFPVYTSDLRLNLKTAVH